MDLINCKICSSETKRFFIKAVDSFYYECSDCGFIFKDEIKLLDKKAEKAIYDQHQNTIENQGYVDMFENFLDYSLDGIKEIKEVLDFGSGPGPVLRELLRRRDYNVDIYDAYYSPEKVYEGKLYDLISSTEVFEHFYEPLESIGIIEKHLKKGAYLIVMTKFYNTEIDFGKWWYKNDPSHVSFYTIKAFEKIAKRFNFEIIKNNGKNIIVLRKR